MTGEVWTEQRIRSYGVRMPGLDAVQARYGVGRTKAYELLAAGELDFPVIKVGRRYVVATENVLRLLGLGGHRESAA